MASKFVESMKQRWGVGPWGVVAVLLAFSLAGMSVLKLSALILGIVLPADSPFWLKASAYVLLIMPLYQVLLLAYGTLLGQFRFFWDKQKRLGRLFKRRLVPTRPAEPESS